MNSDGGQLTWVLNILSRHLIVSQRWCWDFECGAWKGYTLLNPKTPVSQHYIATFKLLKEATVLWNQPLEIKQILPCGQMPIKYSMVSLCLYMNMSDRVQVDSMASQWRAQSSQLWPWLYFRTALQTDEACCIPCHAFPAYAQNSLGGHGEPAWCHKRCWMHVVGLFEKCVRGDGEADSI